MYLFEYSLWINISLKPGVNISLQPTSTSLLTSLNISTQLEVNISPKPDEISPQPGETSILILALTSLYSLVESLRIQAKYISSQPDQNISPNPLRHMPSMC